MSWISFLYRKIDPERLIPVRTWVLVGSLGLLTAILFGSTLLLTFLEGLSDQRSAEIIQGFVNTRGLRYELDSLQIIMRRHEKLLSQVLEESDVAAMTEIPKAQENFISIYNNTDKKILPQSREDWNQIKKWADEAFESANELLATAKSQPQLLARTMPEQRNSARYINTISKLAEQIRLTRNDLMYKHLQNQVDDAYGTIRSSIIPMSLLAALMLFMMLFFLGNHVRMVLRHRRKLHLLYEEQLKATEFAKNTLNKAPLGYHSFDKTGNLLDINETELNWLGYSRDEVIGKKTTLDLISQKDRNAFGQQIDLLISKGFITNVEQNWISKDGSIVPVIVNARAYYLNDGTFSHGISIVFNFAERKQQEETLIRAREEAEKANHFKHLFMANMSHEIRTPLNAIMGFSDLLGRRGLSPEQRSEYIYNIQNAGANLLAIVNDILDMEKIQSGMLRMEQVEFNLHELLQSAVNLVRQGATEKQLALYVGVESDLPGILVGDPMRVTQILVNLLNNAIKFTEKGHVTLRASVLKVECPKTVCIRFEVEDTGVGIPESEHERIFERFVQGSSDMTRKFGGTGLGLSLVKMLVELNSGTVRVKSEPGRGSTFIVDIPFSMVETQAPKPPLPTPADEPLPDMAGGHVLLVEDNPINSRIAELYLQELGLKVTSVVNGLEAVEALRAHATSYDLVFMDIQMPEMDGYTATKVIRNELGLTNLPIIAMTAHVFAGEKEHVLASGLNDYLPKPVNHSDLVAILQRYLPSRIGS